MNATLQGLMSGIRSYHALVIVLIAAVMPLSKRAIPVLIALWVVLAVVQFRIPRRMDVRITLIWPFLYYLCVLLWQIPSQNVEAARFALEVKFSLLLFPLIWTFLRPLEQRMRINVLLALVWGCAAMVVISIARASYIWFETGDWGSFFYSRLAWFFHPTYLAGYDAFALVVLCRIYTRKMFALGSAWLHLLLSLLLVIHVVLLQSKAGYLCMVVAVILAMIMLFRRNRRQALFMAIGAFAVLFTAVMLVPSARGRVGELLNSGASMQQMFDPPNTDVTDSAEGSTVGRLVAWRSSVELMVENPWGVGTGDVTDRLVEIYSRDKNAYAIRKALNPHNQFLQAGVAFGWIGLAVMLGMFIFGFRSALRSRDFVFTSFLALMLLNMLFESFLEVQSGVVFFAFFYSFFVVNPSDRV